MEVFDDGNGSALYVGGGFTQVDGQVVNMVAKWDGSAWSTVGDFSGNVYVANLAVWDDGNGAALYAAGRFLGSNVKILDGSQWQDLGNATYSSPANAIVGFDGSGGPGLVAGGVFTGLPGFDGISFAAIWDGHIWTPLGICLNDGVDALAVFDDGSGDSVYLGGRFRDPSANFPSYLARWNGAFGDTNHDTVVDLLEYREFEQCLAGPLSAINEAMCGCSDLNGDGFVDQRDAALLWALIHP
jgi:hypothetical protein